MSDGESIAGKEREVIFSSSIHRALSREQVESICADIEAMIDSDGVAASDFLKHDAAQRATIARQAQEIEWLKGHPMGHPIMGRNILQEDVAKLRMQLATAQARVTLLEEYQKACTGIEDNLAKCIEENEHLQATLAAKEAKIAELADLCRQAGLRLTELTSPVHEP